MTNEAYVWHKNAKVEILRGVPLYWYLEKKKKIIMQRKQRLIFKKCIVSYVLQSSRVER